MDNTVKVGAVSFEATQSEHIKVQAEQSGFNARAEVVTCSPDDQQKIDDDRLIPKVGDTRELETQGTIHSPDGETMIPCRNVFTRTRNKNGGVDVLCMVHAFGIGSTNPT